MLAVNVATNEPRSGDVEVVRAQVRSMAESHNNGYVYDKLLKKWIPLIFLLPDKEGHYKYSNT